MKNNYNHRQPNYLFSRTAIEAECAVLTLVYFYILCNNKNYKKASEFLRARCLHRPFKQQF